MFVLSSKAAVIYEIKKGEYRSIVRNMRMISPKAGEREVRRGKAREEGEIEQVQKKR